MIGKIRLIQPIYLLELFHFSIGKEFMPNLYC